MQNNKAESQPSYETAIAELESIVNQMESEKLSLEQSLSAYKRGTELLKICQQSLAAAEQQIKIVSEENELTDYSQD
jgi:exodeoxyribonuclease VII small subunit